VTPTNSKSQQLTSNNSETSPGIFKISTIKKLYPRRGSRQKVIPTDNPIPLDLSNSSTDSSPTKRSSVIVSQKDTTLKTKDNHGHSTSSEAANIKSSLRSSKSNAGGSRKCTPVFHVPGVVSPVSGVVSLVAGEVSPVDGLVSSIAGVVSPVDRVMSPFRGVVSPVPSTSAAGVSSPSSVYSTAPEELRVTSPGDISLKSQSSYHTGKSSIPRSHMMSSQGLGSDPSSQCISPVSEDASQSSFHTIVSSQHTEADITEDNITEYEDDILHNKDGDISMDEIEIIFESFTVPERIPTSRTSSDTSLKEGFLNSLIQKGITMISPSKKTDLNKSLSGANENLSLAVEDKLRESSVYESREHETAAGIQDPNINQDTADDASKEEDSVVNEELTENAKQSTSAEEREAASIRKRRRSSHYNWPTRFKQGDSLEQAR
jgi:hypothetical protein